MTIKTSHSLMVRVLSAVILAPLMIFAVIYGDYPFLIVMGLAAIISCWEWIRMARHAVQPFINGVAGLLYILVAIGAFVMLRFGYNDGAALTLCLMLSIWASDIGAYFAGKTFGGPKMAPGISPNKTWAGLIGAIAASAVTFIFYSLYIGPFFENITGFKTSFINHPDWWILLLIGGVLAVTGQAGDLLISREKRMAGVKDTGALIPGHGGLLDRIDSILLGAIVFYLIVKIVPL